MASLRHCASRRRQSPVTARLGVPRPVMRCSLLALLISHLPGMPALAAPVPGSRIALTALPSGATGNPQVGTIAGRRIFAPRVASGSFGAYQVNGNADGTASAVIRQTSNAGILEWQTFDIGANATVNVIQPASTSVLLNKVASGEYNQTTLIEGKLSGNGQIYIYNPNGIIFGKTSQVNVNSLVATTLNIDDQRFLGGLIAPSAYPILQRAGGRPGNIVVEGDADGAAAPQQASITAAPGGKIVLVGSAVSNAGKLSAADGQVVMAAATDRVFLAAPDDVTMRGLLVEVGNGGTVTNETLGKIAVGHGNATLVGLAVNQNGRISASTSVQANGSIYLRARDQAQKDDNNPVNSKAQATRGGTLTLGKGSVSEVLPDLGDATAAARSAYIPSKVELAGESVHLAENAQVVAPGGDVTVTAQADPKVRSAAGIVGGTVGGRGVYMEAGSSIDVAGTTTTSLAMESNVIAVELRGSELADVPLQRDSVLRGKTVYIDRRKGTPLANVQGWLDLVEYTVGENTAAGGTVTFNADQDVVMANGSRVDVSGGKVSYRGGHVATTQLQSGAFSVDIGSASPDRIYTAVAAATPGPRNFEAGYSDGYSAGSIRFNAATLVLRGDLLGKATPGVRQRDAGAANSPKGGELVIGAGSRIASGALGSFADFSYLGKVDIGGNSTAAVATPAFGDVWAAANADQRLLRSTVDLDAASLSRNGFTRINTYARSDERPADDPWGSTVGEVVVGSAINLQAGGELRLAAQQSVAVGANVTVPSGTVEAVAATSTLRVADGVNINVAGLWSNDRSQPAPAVDAAGNFLTPVSIQGGSISLTGKGSTLLNGGLAVSVGAGARFDASGGAWNNSAGKISGGNGGSIALVAKPEDELLPQVTGTQLGAGVDFRAYGTSKGGTLKLTGRNVVIGGNAVDPLDLALSSSFFERGGFAKYEVSATGNLTVAANAQLTPRMQNWLANRGTATRASGAMADAFDVALLPLAGAQGSRGASSLSLSAQAKLTDGAGRLWLQQGAAITTDPGATVSLSAGRQLTAAGRITAPGGTVNLLLSPSPEDFSTLSYRPERSIWLGATASIDVGGTAARLWANSNGLSQGDLLDGGRICLGRLAGSELAPAIGYVIVDQGARLNAAGTRADVTLAAGRFGAVSRSLASAGGAIDIRAREGMLIDGSFSAAGGASSVAGGSLNLVLDREAVGGPEGAPDVPRTLTVLAHRPAGGDLVPTGLQADQPVADSLAGKGSVLADTLNTAGFDRIRLKSQDRIGFDTAGAQLGLAARAELSLDAPVLAASGGGKVALDAERVLLGNTDWRYQPQGAGAQATTTGATHLAVTAGTIDIVGSSAWQGIAAADLAASQDVRLAGIVAADLLAPAPVSLPSLHALGSLRSAGDVHITAAQMFPTTMSEFALAAAGTLALDRRAGLPAKPLSAAGKLSLTAANIRQDGVLRAPFGSLTLTAAERLTFGAGSETSVAGADRVPLGLISNGRNWLYDFGNGHTVTLNDAGASNAFTLPEKKIAASAPDVQVAKGAVLDMAGGGDLYAYEFTAGPGGSRDVLAKAAGAAAVTTFAVLPGYAGAVAPLDFQYQQDGGFQAGDRVYLSGLPGLTAGYYTLLPGHYALLPGAYSISGVAGSRDMAAAGNYQNLDGTWVVAGFRASQVGTDGRWSGFRLASAAQVRQQSGYSDYLASGFLARAVGQRPADGGHLAVSAGSSLTLDGSLRLAGAGGSSGGLVDISAPQITVVASLAQKASDGVTLAAGALQATGADSLLLGGIRQAGADGTHVVVGAQNVTIANDAQHPLVGPEIIVAAKDQVHVVADSRIEGKGTSGRSDSTLIIDGKGGEADGALLRVTGGAAGTVVREAPAQAKGTLRIDPPSGPQAATTIAADGAVTLDATKDLANGGKVALGTGATLSLGANRISFGADVPTSVPGLRFDAAGLADLGKLSSLALTSYSSFDVYGSATLGSASTQFLSLRGAGIQFNGGAGDVFQMSATSLRFDGAGSLAPAAASAGAAGRVEVTATDVAIGSGSFAIRGVTGTTISANRELRAVGQNGTLDIEGTLAVDNGRISTAGGSAATLRSTGAMALTKATAAAAPVATEGLGGSLRFVGETVTSSADIRASSGQITFSAADGVTIAGGSIAAAGSSKQFGSAIAYAPGGTVSIDAGNGSVVLAAGATIDVSAVGGDGGSLAIRAGRGTASLSGTLRGAATAASDGGVGRQGMIDIDVGQSSDFGGLNQRLDAAGFTESRQFRIRNGDVALGPGESIRAANVLVAVDNGDLSIAGTIDANGGKGGSIQLYAAQAVAGGGKGNVRIGEGAVLTARSTQAAEKVSSAGSMGDGGRIVIGAANADGSMVGAATGNGSISVQAGATLDVSASGAGQGGSVLFRAPRVGSGDQAGQDVAVSGNLAGAVRGSRETVVEAVKSYAANNISAAADSSSNLDAGSSGRMYRDASVFAATAAAAANRLGGGVKVLPGIEVRSTENLTVSVNETARNAQDRGWNLNAWRFNGDAGVLTLRAAGNLDIQGSISDGFVKPTARIALPGWELDRTGAASWSYRLIGGADPAAASPLAVAPSQAQGDVAIGFARTANLLRDQPVALVRTGSGRIDVAAGRDVKFGAVTVKVPDPLLGFNTNAVLAASLYTAGRYSATDPNFVAPTNQAVNPIYANGSSANLSASFADGGGGIEIVAARDVTGVATRQQANSWLFRRGALSADAAASPGFAGPVLSDANPYESVMSTAWWSRYDFFNQGVATFGGGDVVVRAGRDITDFSASTATNGQLPGRAPGQQALIERGGGDLSVRAGGDIRGGSFYVQKGEGRVQAGGSVLAGNATLADEDLGTVSLRPVLALGDATLAVIGGGKVQIETAFNPTLAPQNLYNAAGMDTGLGRESHLSNFSTYGEGSAVSLTAVAGDLEIGNRVLPLTNSAAPWLTLFSNSSYLVYPGSLRATAFSGDLAVANGMSLWPSSKGQLELLAEGNLNLSIAKRSQGYLKGLAITGAQPIVMVDAAPTSLPTVSAPQAIFDDASSILTPIAGANGLAAHDGAGLHAGDGEPVRLIARSGDIVGDSHYGTSNLQDSLIVPKRVEILAGRDIANLGFQIQHLSAQDVSSITAGRDFVDTTYAGLSPVRHLVDGPGRLDLYAGRNIDLGSSHGVVSRGNLDNPYLPEGGAGLVLVAGAKPDYAAFAARYLKLEDLAAADQADLLAYVANLDPALPAGANAEAAFARFQTLAASTRQGFLEARKPLLNDLFFAELRRTSGSAAGGGVDLPAFDAVIASLFPASGIGGGDINVFGSQLKTARGGAISMFAPGGSVQAGLAEKPAWVKAMLASDKAFEADLGVYTVAGGNLQALVRRDFLVNQGRVFTLGGGDITLVSQYGDIDAGKGSKTAQAAPPPILTTDEKGNTVVDISGSIAGSGIATLRTKADIAAASVYPIAPRGVFDAGDAGVRSTGSVNIVAQTVLNAGNIAAAGGVSGARAVDAGGLASAPAAAGSTPAAKTDAVAKAANADAAPSHTLTVELVGYGAGDGQQTVTDHGQNAPAPKKNCGNKPDCY